MCRIVGLLLYELCEVSEIGKKWKLETELTTGVVEELRYKPEDLPLQRMSYNTCLFYISLSFNSLL